MLYNLTPSDFFTSHPLYFASLPAATFDHSLKLSLVEVDHNLAIGNNFAEMTSLYAVTFTVVMCCS